MRGVSIHRPDKASDNEQCAEEELRIAKSNRRFSRRIDSTSILKIASLFFNCTNVDIRARLAEIIARKIMCMVFVDDRLGVREDWVDWRALAIQALGFGNRVLFVENHSQTQTP
jgi:hypothetical protein